MNLYNIRLPHSSRPALLPVLSLHPGERILMLGPSGSGKSSLLRMLAGFTEPAEGSIDDDGKSCALLLQNPFHQIIMRTVRNELYFPQKNTGTPPEEAMEAVSEISALLHITHLLDRDTASLSFGEVQKVMLAATFLTAADVILLDEPTSHLDRRAAEDCYRCADMLAGRGKTLAVASQDPGEYPWFDTLWILENGTVSTVAAAADAPAVYEKHGIVPDSVLIRERLRTLAEGAL